MDKKLFYNVGVEKAKKLYQSVILLPFLMSMVVLSYIVYALLSSENGLVNNAIFRVLNLESIQWYQEPQYWQFIQWMGEKLQMNIWCGVGSPGRTETL